MPPRYAYWTILVDGGPTAFRAAEPDELLPTLKRLQVKQPTAVMKWFEKGRLWDSRDEAREKLGAGYTVDADGALVPPAEGAAPRTKSWRPGGEHRDPREKYQLAKKAKWQKFKQMVRSRPGHGRGRALQKDDVFKPIEEGEQPDPVFVDLLSADADSFEAPDSHSDDTPGGERFDETRPGAPPAPPETDWRGRPKPAAAGPPARARSWSDRPKFGGGDDRPRGPKPEWRGKPSGASEGRGAGWKPRPDGPRGPKPAWRDKPKGEWRAKPGGAGGGARPAWKPRPEGARGPKPEWRDREPSSFDRVDRPRGPKPEWRDKPKSEWRGKPGGASGSGRPAWKPRPDGDRPAWKPRPDGERGAKTFDRGGDRPRGPKPEWRDRGPKTFDRGDDRPRGPKPEWRDTPKGEWRAKPGGGSGGARPAWKPRPDGDRPAWKSRPDGDRGPKPFGGGGDRPRGAKPGGGRPGGFGRGPKPGTFGPKGRGRSGPPKKKY